MAQKDGLIRNLEHQLRERDQEIERLTSNAPQDPQELHKMKDLEMKVVEMESMIKGLTEELLDLKSVVRKLVRVQEEREVRERHPPAPVTIAKQPSEQATKQPAQAKPEAEVVVKKEPEPAIVSSPAPAERKQTVTSIGKCEECLEKEISCDIDDKIRDIQTFYQAFTHEMDILFNDLDKLVDRRKEIYKGDENNG